MNVKDSYGLEQKLAIRQTETSLLKVAQYFPSVFIKGIQFFFDITPLCYDIK